MRSHSGQLSKRLAPLSAHACRHHEKISWKAVHLFFVGLAALLLLHCNTGAGTEERHVKRRVPYPILFLHGLGGSAKTWDDSGLTAFLEARGLRNGGVVRLGEDGHVKILGSPEQADFFLLEVDSFQSLQGWTRALAKLIAAVRAATHAPRVVLVGHSAGGLAGRKYVVEHPLGHHVAKILTIASPHKGSELAWASILKPLLREGASQDNGTSFIYRMLDERLTALERKVGIPLDSPILKDLIPESHNPVLAALNRKPHPGDLEYACVLAVGSPGFQDMEDLERDLIRISNGELDKSRALEWLRTNAMALIRLLDGNQLFQGGDGAVLVESQDLREVSFFKDHRDLIKGCLSAEVGHHSVNAQYSVILQGIESPVRFLRARIAPNPGRAGMKLEVDFHDYLAGISGVSARDPQTGRSLPVSRPEIFQRGDESFGRVLIGPIDPSRTTMVDVLVRSLDRGQLFGKRVPLARASGSKRAALSIAGKPEPVALTLLGVDGIPGRRPSGLPWKLDFSPPAVELVLLADQREVLRTRTFENVQGSLALHDTVEFAVDPRRVRLILEVWGQSSLAPELMGRVVWNPGELPRGPAVTKTEQGLAARIDVEGPLEECVNWDGGS